MQPPAVDQFLADRSWFQHYLNRDHTKILAEGQTYDEICQEYEIEHEDILAVVQYAPINYSK
jgi:hypothetical protein